MNLEDVWEGECSRCGARYWSYLGETQEDEQLCDDCLHQELTGEPGRYYETSDIDEMLDQIDIYYRRKDTSG